MDTVGESINNVFSVDHQGVQYIVGTAYTLQRKSTCCSFMQQLKIQQTQAGGNHLIQCMTQHCADVSSDPGHWRSTTCNLFRDAVC